MSVYSGKNYYCKKYSSNKYKSIKGNDLFGSIRLCNPLDERKSGLEKNYSLSNFYQSVINTRDINKK